MIAVDMCTIACLTFLCSAHLCRTMGTPLCNGACNENDSMFDNANGLRVTEFAVLLRFVAGPETAPQKLQAMALSTSQVTSF